MKQKPTKDSKTLCHSNLYDPLSSIYSKKFQFFSFFFLIDNNSLLVCGSDILQPRSYAIRRSLSPCSCSPKAGQRRERYKLSKKLVLSACGSEFDSLRAERLLQWGD
ncbi:hypothetical protein SAY87_013177 [Trapa incisa]|uniref:Uncharacterized protein n=1 Tax=Trapa incisa TaxID=236973 RepID=A0AAN7KEP3_9MYRT|nr:hypothetical protein SAY87_013177 [Trapa incisa]